MADDLPISPDRLEQLLALPVPGDATLPQLFEALYERRYTGQITLHFHAGQPRTVDFPRPQLKLA